MLSFLKQQGWIGIDAGSSTVKLAQVSLIGGRLRLDHAAVVPRAEAWEPGAGAPFSSLQEIESALAIAGGVAGRNAAAVLSMATCELGVGKTLVAAASPASGEASTGGGICTDAWQADPSAGDDGWYQLACPEPTADGLCRDLQNARLLCRGIDAAPTAFARLVALAAPSDASRTVGLIDWGSSGALYCSIQNGRPVYTRMLKGCGLAELNELLGDELQADPLRVAEVMASLGTGDRSSAAAQLVEELARPWVERLESALRETLRHLRMHRKRLAPQKLLLMGGGASLGVEQRLSKQTGVPCQVWSLPGSPEAPAAPQAVLGPAIACSALAWQSRIAKQGRR